MELLKLAVPAATGALGLVKLLDKSSKWMRVLTSVLIIIGGAGSAVLVQTSGRLVERRAVAAEQAQQRAEEKLDRMTDALLVIQENLAGLQVQFAKAPKGTNNAAAVGEALRATIQRVADAKGILELPTGKSVIPGKVTTPVTKPAVKPATGK
jgi:hypothetical protein